MGFDNKRVGKHSKMFCYQISLKLGNKIYDFKKYFAFLLRGVQVLYKKGFPNSGKGRFLGWTTTTTTTTKTITKTTTLTKTTSTTFHLLMT